MSRQAAMKRVSLDKRKQADDFPNLEALRLVDPEYEKKIKELTSTKGLSSKRPDRQKIEPELYNQIMDTINKRKVQIEEYKRENPTPQASCDENIGDIELVQTEYRKKMEEYNIFGENYVNKQKEKYRRIRMVDQLVEDLDKYQDVLKKTELQDEEEFVMWVPPSIPKPKRKSKVERKPPTVEPRPKLAKPPTPEKPVVPLYIKPAEKGTTLTLHLDDMKQSPKIPNAPPMKDGATQRPLKDEEVANRKSKQCSTDNSSRPQSTSTEPPYSNKSTNENFSGIPFEIYNVATPTLEAESLKDCSSFTSSQHTIPSKKPSKASRDLNSPAIRSKERHNLDISPQIIPAKITDGENINKMHDFSDIKSWTTISDSYSLSESDSWSRSDFLPGSRNLASDFSTSELVSTSIPDNSINDVSCVEKSSEHVFRNNNDKAENSMPCPERMIHSTTQKTRVVQEYKTRKQMDYANCPTINLPGEAADTSDDECYLEKRSRDINYCHRHIISRPNAKAHINSSKQRDVKSIKTPNELNVNKFLTVLQIA